MKKYIARKMRGLITAAIKDALADPELRQRLFTAPESAANLEPSAPMKIDVADIFRQMNDPKTDGIVREYFLRNNRFVRLLIHRSDRAAADTYDFIDREMRAAVFATDQHAIIADHKGEICALGGPVLDLGVYKGASTRRLAQIFDPNIIHGFDSFEGLPENWSHARKGSFGDVNGALPSVPDGVTLHKGWFNETLPVWNEKQPEGPISLLRVDCDIYSSTKDIFEILGHRVVPGTWICFDELIGYYGWQDHEHKAFMEFIERTGYRYEYVAYGLTYTIAKVL